MVEFQSQKPRGPRTGPSRTTPQLSMVMSVTSSSPTSWRRPSWLRLYRPFLQPFCSPPFMPYGTSRSRLLGITRRSSPASLKPKSKGGSGADDLRHTLRCSSSFWRSSLLLS